MEARNFTGFVLAGIVCLCVGTTDLGGQGSGGECTPVPARIEGGRFFVHPVTQGGDTLTFFVDTGGGLFLYEDMAEALGLPMRDVPLREGKVTISTWPDFEPSASIPRPRFRYASFVPVRRAPDRVGEFRTYSGVLGQEYFARRTWTFDWIRGSICWSEGRWTGDSEAHRIPIDFRVWDGLTISWVPRLNAVVDEDTLPMTLDTGSMAALSDKALAVLADGGPAIRGMSTIVATRVERWRRKHPEWRVVESADRSATGAVMIEVPELTIAGWTVGPVWFVSRSRDYFRERVWPETEARIEGQLGGSVLGRFRVTVDYENAVAWFERPGLP